ncbi:hypothetical protein WA158_002663 [Blastocystis sp. Blastoise]
MLLLFLFIEFCLSLTCLEQESQIYIRRVYKQNATIEGFRIKEGYSILGDTILDVSGSAKDYVEYNYTLCLKSMFYTLVASSPDPSGWVPESSITIYNDDTVLLYDSLLYGTYDSWSFFPTNMISASNKWKYHNGVLDNNLWKSIVFNDDTWPEYCLHQFPSTNDVIYYRYKTNIPQSIDTFSSFIIGFSTLHNITIYVNGLLLYPISEINTNYANNNHSRLSSWRHSHSRTLPSTPYYQHIDANYDYYLKPFSSITIAVQITPKSSESMRDPFNLYMYYVLDSHSRRLQNITVTDLYFPSYSSSLTSFSSTASTSLISDPSIDTFNPNNVVDFSLDTYYLGTVGTNHAIFFLYPLGRYEFVNCIYLYSPMLNSNYTITKFGLFGSNDEGVEWIPIIASSQVRFLSPTTPYIMNIPSSFYPFNIYKLVIYETKGHSNKYELSEIVLLTIPLNYISNLTYTPLTSCYYKDMNSIALFPISSGFSQFQIHSILPLGLYFETFDGSILGTASEIGTFKITITAYSSVTKINNSYTFSMVIKECSSDKYSMLYIHKFSDIEHYSYEYFSIVVGTQTLINIHGESNQESIFPLCVPSGLLTLTLYNPYNPGWSEYSLLTLSIESRHSPYTIFRATLRNTFSYTYTINTLYTILPYDKDTLCHLDNTYVPSNWNTEDFRQDSHWSNCYTIPDLEITSHTAYFRREFFLLKKSTYHGMGIRLSTSNPIIIYMNGGVLYDSTNDFLFLNNNKQETKRYNNNEELKSTSSNPSLLIGIDSQTSSQVYNSNSPYTSLSFDMEIIKDGLNILSFAIYLPYNQTLPAQSNFTYSLRFFTATHLSARTFDMTVSLIDIFDDYKRMNTSYSYNYTYKDETEPAEQIDDDHSNVNTLLDGFYSTFWIGSFMGNKTLHIYLYYNSKYRFEYTNKYCLILSSLPSSYDPQNWYFIGCTNSICWELDQRENVQWFERGQKLCFYTRTHRNSYYYYSFIFKPSNNQEYIALGEIELLLENTYSLIYHPLSYIKNEVSLLTNVTADTMIPTTNYKSFQIVSGSLPKGLWLDMNTGLINGILKESIRDCEVTIQGTTLIDTSYNTTITISSNTCSDQQQLITISVHRGDNAHDLTISYEIVFQFEFDKDLSDVLDKQSVFPANTVTSHSYCLTPGIYSLILSEPSGEGWENAVLYIQQKNSLRSNPYTLYYGYLTSTFQFIVEHSRNPLSTPWYYLISDNSHYYPDDITWTSTTIIDDGWTNGPSSNMPTSSAITQYYKYITPKPESILVITASALCSIHVYGGAILYMNGFELFRYNMPEGPINSFTLALKDFNEYKQLEYSIQVQVKEYFNEANTNIFGIEIHRRNQTIPQYSFWVNFQILIDNQNYNYQYNIKSSYIGYNSHTVDTLIDGDIYTQFYVPYICKGVSFILNTPEERKYNFNSYTIITANNCNINHPSGWILEGSYDQKQWVQLHSVTKQFWTIYYQKKTYQFYQINSYNYYRVTITECENSPLLSDNNEECLKFGHSFHLSEFQMKIQRYPGLCYDNTTLWPTTIFNDYSYVPCGLFYTGSMSRFCNNGILDTTIDRSKCSFVPFTRFQYPYTLFICQSNQTNISVIPIVDSLGITFSVYPLLPLGLELNLKTGHISGIPKEESILTNYTITATSWDESIMMEQMISIAVEGVLINEWCMGNTIWPNTYKNTYAEIPCSNGTIGTRRRLCLENKQLHTTSWESIEETCIDEHIYPSVIYSQSQYDLLINEYKQIIPQVTGTIVSWISTVEEGKSINCITIINGVIRVNCPSLMNPVTYKIEAYSQVGVIITNFITLRVYECICKEEEDSFHQGNVTVSYIWPSLGFDKIQSLDCPSYSMSQHYYTGSLTRQCLSTNQSKTKCSWSSTVSTCILATPTLSYTPDFIHSEKNQTIIIPPPIITGGICLSFSIHPALTNGLTLNTITGEITGVITISEENAYYLIVCHYDIDDNNNITSSRLSVTTLGVHIYVSTCSSEDTWQETPKGTTLTKPCTNQYLEGAYERTCLSTNPPQWSPVIDRCIYKTPIVAYPMSTMIFYKNETIQTLSPTIQNYISGWSISPLFTNGLLFNTRSGVISGTPKQTAGSHEYRITAFNRDTNVTITIRVIIVAYMCNTEGDWPATEAGTTNYIRCTTRAAVGYRYRPCFLEEKNPVWGSINDESCTRASKEHTLIPVKGSTILRFPIRFEQLGDLSLKGYDIYLLNSTFNTFFETSILKGFNISRDITNYSLSRFVFPSSISFLSSSSSSLSSSSSSSSSSVLHTSIYDNSTYLIVSLVCPSEYVHFVNQSVYNYIVTNSFLKDLVDKQVSFSIPSITLSSHWIQQQEYIQATCPVLSIHIIKKRKIENEKKSMKSRAHGYIMSNNRFSSTLPVVYTDQSVLLSQL